MEFLEQFVDATDNMTTCEMMLRQKGDLLLDLPHASTYLMLSCLEHEMEGDKEKRMYKYAQQNQLLAHITELAKGFQRPPRDLVVRWFEKIATNEGAKNV